MSTRTHVLGGMVAYAAGKARADCPYHPEDARALLWRYGYDVAKAKRPGDDAPIGHLRRNVTRETRGVKPGRGRTVFGWRSEWAPIEEGALALADQDRAFFTTDLLVDMLARSPQAIRAKRCRCARVYSPQPVCAGSPREAVPR